MGEAVFVQTAMEIAVADDKYADDRDLQNLDGDPHKNKKFHLASTSRLELATARPVART